jgi:hypothetical protein
VAGPSKHHHRVGWNLANREELIANCEPRKSARKGLRDGAFAAFSVIFCFVTMGSSVSKRCRCALIPSDRVRGPPNPINQTEW